MTRVTAVIARVSRAPPLMSKKIFTREKSDRLLRLLALQEETYQEKV